MSTIIKFDVFGKFVKVRTKSKWVCSSKYEKYRLLPRVRMVLFNNTRICYDYTRTGKK